MELTEIGVELTNEIGGAGLTTIDGCLILCICLFTVKFFGSAAFLLLLNQSKPTIKAITNNAPNKINIIVIIIQFPEEVVVLQLSQFG